MTSTISLSLSCLAKKACVGTTPMVVHLLGARKGLPDFLGDDSEVNDHGVLWVLGSLSHRDVPPHLKQQGGAFLHNG